MIRARFREIAVAAVMVPDAEAIMNLISTSQNPIPFHESAKLSPPQINAFTKLIKLKRMIQTTRQIAEVFLFLMCQASGTERRTVERPHITRKNFTSHIILFWVCTDDCELNTERSKKK